MMNNLFYLKIIAIVIFILFIMYQYPHIFYPQELTEGFFDSDNKKEERPYIFEKSIKFSPDKKYNNNRYIYLYGNNSFKGKEKSILINHKAEPEFYKFYQDRKDNRNKKFYQLDIKDPAIIKGSVNVKEFIIGEDKVAKSKKIYYTVNNNIYGIIKKNDNIYYRLYRNDSNFSKEKLEKLVGKERADSFNKIFNLKKDGELLFEGKKSFIFEIFETQSLNKKKEDPFAFNFYVKPLNFKLGFQKEKLKKILKDFNCNIDGFDKWCQSKENNKKILNWVTVSRQGVKPTITFYYSN